MPAQMHTCLICGEQVSKPQSWAYKDGRACRTHEEASVAHAEAEAKAIQDKSVKNKSKPEKGYELKFSCWHCNCEGKHKIDILAELISAHDEGREIAPEYVNAVPLIRLALPQGFPQWKLQQLVNNDQGKMEAARIVQMVLLCESCIKEYKLEYYSIGHALALSTLLDRVG